MDKDGEKMKKNVVLSESLEDYLEVILELEKTHKVARVKDIAEKMGVQRGSVSGTLKSLKKKELVNYRPYSFITLTIQGKKLAEEICRRHQVIKKFLQSVLLIDESKAEENACRMEHAMDKSAINRLVQFIDYIYRCPRTGEDWIGNFNTFFTQNKIADANCPECLNACLKRYSQKKTE